MKMVLLPDHIPVNNFNLIVVGGPPLIQFVTIGGFDWELDTVDLPDRTKASGGATKAIEFTATHPKHHVVEDVFLQAWFQEAQLGFPTYKKAASLVNKSISGFQVRTWNLIGMFPMKQVTADLDMANEGEMNVTEWTFVADLPIPV
jgi:hypothetical protein